MQLIPTLDRSGGKGEAPKPEKKAEKARKDEPRRAQKRDTPKPEKRREHRKPEPMDEADDDGWNGPVPSFLSLSAD